MVYEALMGNLSKIGFYEFILPWLLFLAILYGLLQKTKVVSEEVAVNGTIAAVGAFLIINYTGIGLVMTQIFYMLALILALILVAVLSLAIAGVDISKWTPEKKTAGPIYAILGVSGLVAVTVFGIVQWDLTIDFTAVVTLLVIIVMLVAVGGIAFAGKS